MKLSTQLAELITSRESFDKSIKFILSSFLKDFHPDLVKELTWILEGEFGHYMSIAEKNLEKVYTEEQLAILIQLYAKYSWLASKSEELVKLNTIDAMEFGKRIGEIVTKNLQEIGDLERIIKEGLFVNKEDKEDECTYNPD
jgi:hypothetical protein